jgi:hypothetical protein
LARPPPRWPSKAYPRRACGQQRCRQAVYTLNAKGKEAAKKAGRAPLTFHALTPDGNECFHDAITAAKVA